jgi:hypothetical protein
MSALLSKMRGWNNSSLGMYVDDGILFACAQEWEEVERLLRARYTICEEWLRRSGLAIEPDKTELLFFQKLYECNSTAAPTRLILPDPVASSYYVVTPVENLRYLGGVLHRWGRATRWLFEPSGFDSEAQTAASEEATSRKASRTRESRASEGEDERERGERSRAETRADGRMDGTQQDRFDSSATGDFYTSILNFLGDRVKDKQRRAKVQTDQGKCE